MAAAVRARARGHVHAVTGQRVDLMRMRYGCGLFGVAAVVYVIRQRALKPIDLSSLIAVGLGLYISLRYSSVSALGPHYHVFGLIHLEPGGRRGDPGLYAYLASHGRKLRDDQHGRVWALSSPAPQ